MTTGICLLGPFGPLGPFVPFVPSDRWSYDDALLDSAPHRIRGLSVTDPVNTTLAYLNRHLETPERVPGSGKYACLSVRHRLF